MARMSSGITDSPSSTASAAAARPVPHWPRLRAAPTERDLTLSSLARAWYDAFAPAMRPRHLRARYPRVANRLALCWADDVLITRLFDDLLIDRRGGRRGFPAAVAAELSQLRALRERLGPAS